jgi:hypothetical protein
LGALPPNPRHLSLWANSMIEKQGAAPWQYSVHVNLVNNEGSEFRL